MFNSFLSPVCKVTKKIDKLEDIAKSLAMLMKQDVLVGIPQDRSSRPGGQITNAELGYVLAHGVRPAHVRAEIKDAQKAGSSYSQALGAYMLEHGDPLWQIPPRPFLEPAFKANADKLRVQQLKIIKAALEGSPEKMSIEVQKLGLLGQSIVKAWFVDPRNGWAPNAPSTIAAKGSDKPLIDTGELRNSISYVVRNKND